MPTHRELPYTDEERAARPHMYPRSLAPRRPPRRTLQESRTPWYRQPLTPLEILLGGIIVGALLAYKAHGLGIF